MQQFKKISYLFMLTMCAYFLVNISEFSISSVVKKVGFDNAISKSAYAESGSGSLPFCSAFFSHALQTHSSNSSHGINFSCGGYTSANPDNILPTNSLVQNTHCTPTCSTSFCSAGTNTNPIEIGSFEYTSSSQNYTNITSTVTLAPGDYRNIRVKSGGILNLTGGDGTEYKLRELRIEGGGIVNFGPGTYWIERNDLNSSGVMNVGDTGTTYIISDKQWEFKSGFVVNVSGSNPAQNLFIYSFNKILVKSGVNVAAIMYAQDDVDVDSGSSVSGAILARKINIKSGASVTYDSTAVENLSIPGVCDSDDVPTSTITHYVISTSNTGTFCQPQQVTVTAFDGANVKTDYTGTVNLDTNAGSGAWSLVTGNGSLSDSNTTDGQASYQFSAADNGVAVFNLDYNTGPTTINLSTTENGGTGITDDNTEGDINFATHTFLLTSSEVTDPQNYTPYADTQTAGISDTIHVTAYGDNGGSCGIVSNYTGPQNVKFWQDYVNPSSGTQVLSINGNSISSTEGAAANQSVTFSSGKATVSARYRDVGSLKLYIKDDNAGVPMTGSTNNFVVKPAFFAVSVADNPEAADHTGDVFKKAGEQFTVTVTVQDNDGNTTPNYGNESSPAGIQIFSSSLVAPATGRNGSSGTGVLGNDTAFTSIAPGVFQATGVTFDEVGIIKISAQVAGLDYLGVGNVVGPESVNVGRFIPDHFDVSGNTPIISSGCEAGSFTYIGQNLLYSTEPQVVATAKSALNNTTENYIGNFFRLSTDTVEVAYDSNSSVAPLDTTAADADLVITANGSGVGTIDLGDGDGFSFAKVSGTDISPFEAEIAPEVTVVDLDNVAYASNPFTFGGVGSGAGIAFSAGKWMYQGRIAIDNAVGSELISLIVPYRVEYFNGTDYVDNTVDACTQISSSNISLTKDPSSLSSTATATEQSAGLGSIELSAPGENNAGDVDITIDLSSLGENKDYLQHDWPNDGNTDGTYDDNPVGRGTFGISNGDPNVIFTREVY